MRQGKDLFGVETVDRLGQDIQVASLERSLVDMLDRPDLGGGWEEIWRSAESVEYYDIQQVVDAAAAKCHDRRESRLLSRTASG